MHLVVAFEPHPVAVEEAVRAKVPFSMSVYLRRSKQQKAGSSLRILFCHVSLIQLCATKVSEALLVTLDTVSSLQPVTLLSMVDSDQMGWTRCTKRVRLDPFR